MPTLARIGLVKLSQRSLAAQLMGKAKSRKKTLAARRNAKIRWQKQKEKTP